ncbi:MAG TPA: glycosyltransferase family 2 protein, partial [bacterium]|nr:glycosyltransferase family 2 protein [bacterium]
MKIPEAVSVIIPAFNEEVGVGDVVKRVRQVLTKAQIKHEILVVDDGSKDHTALRAYQAGARIISMGENRGYGASIKAGMREAQFPLIAITDADG